MKMKNGVLKILICDDDSQDRNLVRHYIDQIDNGEIVTLEAANKDEIQKALERGRIDLVLMDLQMPEKSGEQWLKEIVENQLAPVIMLTGFGSEEIAAESIQHGAVGYLPKARLSTARIAEMIDKAIDDWRKSVQAQATQEELTRLASIDVLTGLLNKSTILARLDKAISYASRYRAQLSVLILDIDHFKKINDNHGHLVGDDVLEQIGAMLARSIRETDIAGRFGGEEFLIILPRADLSFALTISERIRETIMTAKMTDMNGKVLRVTVSQGLAGYIWGDDQRSLIARADRAMYKAKQNGRNRVEITDSVIAR
jgi:diguanylate cyclase (GGDEF)-like protein